MRLRRLYKMKTSVNISPSTDTPSNSYLTPETQEKIIDVITDKIVVHVPVETTETAIPLFQSYTAEPLLQETITPAEAWATATVAQPLIAKGVKVYNDTPPPPSEPRPREYVVMTVDEEVNDINFAGNTNRRKESLISFIIQGQGNTFENWVVEISKLIQDILRQERTKGKVRSITNRDVGFDETSRLLSRIITVWYQY